MFCILNLPCILLFVCVCTKTIRDILTTRTFKVLFVSTEDKFMFWICALYREKRLIDWLIDCVKGQEAIQHCDLSTEDWGKYDAPHGYQTSTVAVSTWLMSLLYIQVSLVLMSCWCVRNPPSNTSRRFSSTSTFSTHKRCLQVNVRERLVIRLCHYEVTRLPVSL